MKSIKIIIEKHADGYIAYPLGLKGAVVGEGDSYEGALADVKSAIRFHIETFGANALEEDESPVLEAFIAEEYRQGNLTKPDLRSILGFSTSDQIDTFLRAHEVWIEYTPADLEREREDLKRLGL